MPNENTVKTTDRIHPQQAEALTLNAEIVAPLVAVSGGKPTRAAGAAMPAIMSPPT